MIGQRQKMFVPAAGFSWLTRVYDPVMSLLMRERVWRTRLVEQVAPKAGERILDLGCGTGTLTIMLHRACPEAEIVGLDIDSEVLGIARGKADAAGAHVTFWHGCADDPTDVPMFRVGSFDKIVSSLVFHHLATNQKRLALAHARTLLHPGGTIYIADWGKPQNILMRLLFYPVQALDGFANTSDNAQGLLPVFMHEAGFADVSETHHEVTAFGSLRFHRGTKR